MMPFVDEINSLPVIEQCHVIDCFSEIKKQEFEKTTKDKVDQQRNPLI
jgi:hypothetical protein